MNATTPVTIVGSAGADPRTFDERAAGERYYRHPGDVLRLVVWGLATGVLVLLIELAEGTDEGLRDDVADAAALVPEAARQLVLAGAQVAALLVPIVLFGLLAIQHRWRRTILLLLAAALGALVSVALEQLLDVAGTVAGSLASDSWLISTRFPSTPYLAGAAAATVVGAPWLSFAWKRAAHRGLAALVLALILAGTASPTALLLALSAGGTVGAAVLVACGAPNRRPSPAAVATGLTTCGLDVVDLRLERAVGGRAQLYRATSADGRRSFVKVYSRDTRDADQLFRAYRTVVLRDAGEDVTAGPFDRAVEHEALLLVLARRGGAHCPDLHAIAALPDGSTAIAIDDVGGRPLDTLDAAELDTDLLGAVWREVATLHRAGLAHRALRAANIVVGDDGPAIVDLAAARTAADARLKAIDRAELLVSLAEIVGPERAVDAAAGVLSPTDLAAATAYLQPLALSAATRKRAPKSLLASLRDRIAEVTGEQPEPLERLIRVRPRTIVMVATLTGAFYFLLPQLANVDESVRALESANWGWLAGAVLLSGLTYVFAAVGLAGGVRQRIPLVPTTHAQLASSFVNRVTPANVGGMALNVRFLQKAGVPPAEAVTGMGLNVVAGGVVHIVLLIVFFAWAGQGGQANFSVPSSSKLLVVIAVLLALIGIVIATRWGRRIMRRHVLGALRQSLGSIGGLARSPRRLLALFGGSLGVTIAYTLALTCATNAFDAGVSFAEVGAVYLGASLLAAAAPTPGGLGAMEAALVAGLTAVGVDGAIAVAAVLSYRLATFWLPILPGWLSFQHLERRNYI